MSKSGSSFISFLVGAGVGFAAGVLLAPDKGSNTRDKLSYQLDRYRLQLSKVIEDLLESEDLPDSLARSEGKKVIQAAKDKAEALLDDVDELISQIKEGSQKSEES